MTAANTGQAAAIIKPGSRPRQLTLSHSDFKAIRANVPGVPSSVAYYEVPAGYVLALLNKTFTMQLRAYAQGDGVNDAAATGTINLGALGYDVLRSPITAPAFPTQRHPDVSVEVSTDGGTTWAAVNVAAIDFNANTVDYAKPANTAHKWRVFFTFGGGEVKLRAKRPSGSDVAAPNLVGYSFRQLHESDQSNARTAPRFDSIKELPRRWRVEIEVNSSHVVDFAKPAGHMIYLPAALTEIVVTDENRLDAMAEVRLRGGRL